MAVPELSSTTLPVSTPLGFFPELAGSVFAKSIALKFRRMRT
jgi:hypothetical protein